MPSRWSRKVPDKIWSPTRVTGRAETSARAESERDHSVASLDAHRARKKGGFGKAALALGIVLLVQQIESHLLQPLLLGRAVRVHPLAVILAIAAGIIVGGIFGLYGSRHCRHRRHAEKYSGSRF